MAVQPKASTIDITREIGQVRNSALPGANFQATALSKIQLGFKELQKQVTQVTTQQTTPSLVIREKTVDYTAQYTDNIIVNSANAPITIIFPVDQGHTASWFIMCSAGSGSSALINIAATNGTVLGSPNVLPNRLCMVVSDGNNLICAGGT